MEVNYKKNYQSLWLISGLILTLFSYGIFNTGICAWIFAVPLIRYINVRTKWSSIIMLLIGMIFAANITFFRLVDDDFNINNQVFCTYNGIRIWFPFFIYFLCRYFGAKRIIAYCAFPAAVATAEFFIDNPFVSVMTSLSVSQFWNLGLMQVASVTGVVGVSFIVTFFASIVNYVWEKGIRKETVISVIVYGIAVIIIISAGMFRIDKIVTSDKTVRIAAGVENYNLLLEDESILAKYQGSDEEKILKAYIDIITERAKLAALNEASLLLFPEDAFACSESLTEKLIEQVKNTARENKINILLPILILPPDEAQKKKNTLTFINNKGELLNTYLKNHLVPVVEEPFTEKGDGKTPVVEADGVKYTYLICADYTSNKYAYNGREADIFLNPSYDWEAFQYFTSYAVQARAVECGFSVLRTPVNGNIILYDVFGRPLHMANVMNIHTGVIYLDVPKQGRQTVYGVTGNWFPWLCAVYSVFAVLSSFVLKEKYILS